MKNNSIEDLMNSDFWKERQKERAEKEKFIKRGSNVIHLEYLGGSINDASFNIFEKELNKVNLTLSRFDKNGEAYGLLEQYQLVSFLILAQPIIIQFLSGISINASWDVIKHISLTLWKDVKGKSYDKITQHGAEKKEIKFGLKVKLDRNTSFDFELSGDLSEETIENSLDKLLNFLSEQSLNKKFKQADYVYIDKKTGEWKKIDVEQEIRKQVNKQKSKK